MNTHPGFNGTIITLGTLPPKHFKRISTAISSLSSVTQLSNSLRRRFPVTPADANNGSAWQALAFSGNLFETALYTEMYSYIILTKSK